MDKHTQGCFWTGIPWISQAGTSWSRDSFACRRSTVQGGCSSQRPGATRTVTPPLSSALPRCRRDFLKFDHHNYPAFACSQCGRPMLLTTQHTDALLRVVRVNVLNSPSSFPISLILTCTFAALFFLETHKSQRSILSSNFAQSHCGLLRYISGEHGLAGQHMFPKWMLGVKKRVILQQGIATSVLVHQQHG